MVDDPIVAAARLVQGANKTIALTGAGVSTESGIPDFRSKGGLWSRFDPMEYGTFGAFQRDPVKVWRMVAELLAIVEARPNKGHMAMAALEEAGLLAGIITQNIDSLHQKAGSRNVVEFHGTLASFTCLPCQAGYPLSLIKGQALPPLCPRCRAVLKPDVVFFDEEIPAAALMRSRDLVHQADLLIVAGTSCAVEPAATFPETVLAQGGKLIEINKEPVLTGKAEVVLKGGFVQMMTELAVWLQRDV